MARACCEAADGLGGSLHELRVRGGATTSPPSAAPESFDLAAYPWGANVVTFRFPALLQLQNLDEAGISPDQMVQADDSWPITGFMFLPAEELPVTLLMCDQPDGPASFEDMATHECSTLALQDGLQIVASVRCPTAPVKASQVVRREE